MGVALTGRGGGGAGGGGSGGLGVGGCGAGGSGVSWGAGGLGDGLFCAAWGWPVPCWAGTAALSNTISTCGAGGGGGGISPAGHSSSATSPRWASTDTPTPTCSKWRSAPASPSLGRMACALSPSRAARPSSQSAPRL
ncbi:hypothetical protein E3E11_06345 [Oecophyllibacter saccharovorans]|nr:hypothetical protein E3E11_06345 [Oecophyllibacter saccharovorans]